MGGDGQTESSRTTARPSNGITKPSSRKLPRHTQLVNVLRACLRVKKFGPLLGIEKLFRTAQVSPHAECFYLLEQCLAVSGNEGRAMEYALWADKLHENPTGHSVLQPKSSAEGQSAVVSPDSMDISDNSDKEQSSSIDEDDVEEEKQPEDLVDYVTQLEQLVSSPQGTYELLLSERRSKLVWNADMDNSKNILNVSLRVSLDASLKMRSEHGKDVVGLGSSRFRQTDDTHEGSDVYKKAANRAAKRLIDNLEGIVSKIELAAASQLQKGVSERLESWRNGRYAENCVRAFQNAKKLILDDHAGDNTVQRFPGLYGCKVLLFGSVSTGLTLDSSDVDIALVLPKQAEYAKIDSDPQASKRTEVLALLKQRAVKAKMVNVWVIETARIPVLRYRDPCAHVDVDICISKKNPILLSRFLRMHLQHDSRIWELCMLVKFWAKQRFVCGTPEGFINPTGWAIMVIFFLQHVTTSPIAGLYRIKGKKLNHAPIVAVPWRSSQKQELSAEKTLNLLKRFFDYFGNEFNFSRQAISLNLQEASECSVLRGAVENSAVFIEQPLEFRNNVVSHVSLHSLHITRRELRRAHFECVTSGRADRIFQERSVSSSEYLFD